ncbi:hypothetical protein [Pseudoalteromonas atlantica]|uniref:hypothetical protein n=1 Tax=Pseudoalteromonas atlantica TaxID=288 RepID=UPI003736E5E1
MLDEKLEELLKDKLPLKDSINEHLKVAKVESDKVDISRHKLISILESISSDGAYLRQSDVNRVLEGFGIDEGLSDTENELFREIFNKGHGIKESKRKKLHSVIETKKDIAVEKLEADIKDLTDKLNNMGVNDNPELIKLKESVEQIAIQSKKVAAAVKIPSPKNMEVQLVSADSLQRLSEYNSDINILLTLSAVFLGAFLGMLGNLVFSANVSGQAYGVIAILGVVSTLFFGLFYRSDTRKKSLSNDILNDDDGIYLDDYKA